MGKVRIMKIQLEYNGDLWYAKSLFGVHIFEEDRNLFHYLTEIKHSGGRKGYKWLTK